MKRLIYTVSVLFAVQFAFAQKQSVPCATDEMNRKLIEQNPAIGQQQMQFNQAYLDYLKTIDLNTLKATPVGIAKKTGAPKYIIPVVFHILHDNGIFGENRSDADAIQELANMNANYSASNLYRSRIRSIFKDVEGDPQIEFRLAKRDPQGNPTTGIEHLYVGPMTYKAYEHQKMNSWDNTRYLNIWVCASIQSGGGFKAGGYCWFPNSYPSASVDGPIVSIDNGFGVLPSSPRGSNAPFSLVTVSHEVGHYFGLLHPFNGATPITDSCGEDYCSDVPPEYYTPYGTPNNTHEAICGVDVYSAPASCSSPYLPDQMENIMDYYIGPCGSIMFTLQQVARMHFTLENYRRTLWQPENLIATGVSDSLIGIPALVVPIAAFSIYDNRNLTDVRACVGNAVTFKDNSYNGTITKWHWDFGDGMTSEIQNPTAVTYTTSGYKTVSLTVTGTNGTNTKTVNNYIYIEGPGDVKPHVMVHSADWNWANTYLQDGWYFENEDNKATWTRTTRVSYDGYASLELPSFSFQSPSVFYTQSGYNYSLISPSFNFTGASSPYLEFYYSFAANISNVFSPATSSQDALSVLTSIDCGKTWSAPKKKVGGAGYEFNAIPQQGYSTPDPNPLSTYVDGVKNHVLPSLDFLPNGPAQWQKMTVTNIPTQGSVKFKIMFSCLGGNNLYLDKLSLGLATGINEVSAADFKFGVQPNPFSDNTKLTYTMPMKAKVDIRIYDIVGKEVGQVFSGIQETGSQQVVIERSKFNLNSGLYFIKLAIDGTKEFTHKIVVN